LVTGWAVIAATVLVGDEWEGSLHLAIAIRHFAGIVLPASDRQWWHD